MTRVAAIDVGTNTLLCCVVEQGAGAERVVSDASRITRLGAGVDASGVLAAAAIERTLDALTELAANAREQGATLVHGVGTSALRDAANRDVFVERARAIVDRFDVIDGAREAELTFRGALFGLAERAGAVTVVDIGGGSTEIVRGANGVVEQSASLDVGSVRLTERHGLGAEAPRAEQLRAMRADIEAAMRAHVIDPPLVMVAGTATNVAAVALGRDLARGALVPHGEVLDAAELRHAVARLLAASSEERRAMIGVERGRHDVIVAGALILEHVLARSRATEAMIGGGGVRFGLALALLDASC